MSEETAPLDPIPVYLPGKTVAGLGTLDGNSLTIVFEDGSLIPELLTQGLIGLSVIYKTGGVAQDLNQPAAPIEVAPDPEQAADPVDADPTPNATSNE